ncbi:MAG: DUF885 family protein [Calditrichaeota bacterium]|nr:MAG: DUF885 family protein [Calditrichota bacterium]
MKNRNFKSIFFFLVVLFALSSVFSTNGHASDKYEDLVVLFKDWRKFESPPMLHGAPDYTAKTWKKRYDSFKRFRQRLNEIDNSKWSVEQKVEWYVVLAEMNGFDFNYRVLQPWKRDPAFYKSVWTYQSDVPAHEGPTHHATTELWTYSFPLTESEETRLVNDLSVIAPLMKQGQTNLTGNARELWITGIRDIRQQSIDLDNLAEMLGDNMNAKLKTTIAEAKAATETLKIWLEQQAPLKTGPSGIGKENYTWYQQNVHLVPLNWDDEVRILKRELARAWSSLKLEEHRNRHLPKLKAVTSPAEYDALAERSVKKFLAFLRDKEIVTVADYFEAALRAHVGEFVPIEKRNFFRIAMHYDPMPLYSHSYHWFELAMMKHDPHPSLIRRNALLYNIFDSRNEGTATAVEEIFMQAGLYDDNPRVREIIWILIAQRAARGLGSLYAHANEMTMEDAGKIHSEWTPRGWMKTEKELLVFEQHLYLRQPGYGTSYITGKYLLEEMIAAYAHGKEKQGEQFRLKDFFDELNAIGNIPISLVTWQMTGVKDKLFDTLGK